MSALASERGERTEWSGRDVGAEEVADRLLAMNREHARHSRGHAATRTLNLLIAPDAGVSRETLRARLEGLSTRYPSRTIVLREHPEDRLDARVAIDCAIGSGAGRAGYCHDAVELDADAEQLRHADSLVHPLLVNGLPIVLWLPGARASVAELPLARTADAIVLDSGVGSAPAETFARALALASDASVRDLAWMRLARWRQRVATRFEQPAARTLLESAEALELRFAGPDAAAALLLAGWIAARAGWEVARLEGEGQRWSGEASRADGGRVALALGRPAHEAVPDGIHSLALHRDEERVEIVEPVAAPDPARAFAAALRTFDEPARGYRPALAAIAAGMGAA